MHFINIKRSVIIFVSVFHPHFIVKSVFRQIHNIRSAVRSKFHTETIRITMFYSPPFFRINHIFIHHPDFCPLTFQFINSAFFKRNHFLFRPLIKFSKHRNFRRPRCVSPKHHSVFFFMCSKIFICVKCLTLIKFLKFHTNSPSIQSHLFFLTLPS